MYFVECFVGDVNTRPWISKALGLSTCYPTEIAKRPGGALAVGLRNRKYTI
jgi:hypothetical protein